MKQFNPSRIPKGLERRLARFQKYLREIDSKGVLEYGYTQFEGLYRRIDDLAHTYPEYDGPSHLDYPEAETFASELGDELMAFCKECWDTAIASRSKFDWHTVSKLGDLAQLAWDIKYYGQG